MVTYKRVDGEAIHGEWAFALDIESCENEAEYADDPIEYVEQRWALVAERSFTLPTCSQCAEPARFWGLCETHAREDDPDSFSDDSGDAGAPSAPSDDAGQSSPVEPEAKP